MAEPQPKMSVQDRMAKARAAAAAKRAERNAQPAQDFGPEALQQAAPQRERTREPMEKLTRVSGRVEVLGRSGERLSRTRTQVGDIFDVPKHMIPKGWRYQWNPVSVHGNAEIVADMGLMMAQNGWRPVPAERHAGVLVPEGTKGSIIRGGQRLEERPEALSIEAEQEDIRNAKQLVSDRNDALKLSGMRKQMPSGFDMGGKYRGTGGDVRISIDKNLDAPAPSYDLADD